MTLAPTKEVADCQQVGTAEYLVCPPRLVVPGVELTMVGSGSSQTRRIFLCRRLVGIRMYRTGRYDRKGGSSSPVPNNARAEIIRYRSRQRKMNHRYVHRELTVKVKLINL